MFTTTVVTPTRRSVLEPADRDRVAAALSPVLVGLVDLSLVAKQAHWTVVGAEFHSVHAELDEIAAAARADADAVAERLAAVGVVPDARALTVAGSSTLEGVPAEWLDAPRAVSAAADAVDSVARTSRAALRSLGDADPVSEDLLVGVVGRLEARRWMLTAQER